MDDDNVQPRLIALGCVLALLVAILLLLLPGCANPAPIKGGASVQRVEPILQTLQQPQNPEHPSTQEVVETRTEHLPDGRTIVTQRKARTQLGGSQDLAGILGAWAKVKAVGGNRLRDVLFGLVLLLAAWKAWKKENPLIAAVLGLGAIGSMALHWGYGAASVGISYLMLTSFFKGQLFRNKLL